MIAAPYGYLCRISLECRRAGAAHVVLVDFVARGLARGYGPAQSTGCLRPGRGGWPLINGYLADRCRFARVLRFSYAVEAGAVLLPVLGAGPASLMFSSLVVGAFTPESFPACWGACMSC